ncbi:diaminopimelate decarboxylase [Serratia ureilytica]|uniref:diaminopimelate decarboxylase n=1 Tax=Serratia ureilytica TaxID=300181 RepID=UPI001F05BE7D|nr:diaminopimelate decarboxylase [Serratia ureilytica]UMK52117.1 diaminopimelate decarboxylase [Serratia ureilytica]
MAINFNELINKYNKEDYYYIIDLDAIRKAVRRLKSHWEYYFPRLEVAYSYKSNNLSTVTELMLSEGLSAETVSLHEINLALNDGFTGESIYFDGPVKLNEEIEFAISNGIKIQCDNALEVERVILISNHIKVKPKISFRLSVDYKSMGLSRFGMNRDEFHESLLLLQENGIHLSGLHFHSGSNLTSHDYLIKALEYYSIEINKLKDIINFIDIGGGYPASTANCDAVLVNDNYPGRVREALLKHGIDINKVSVVIEPGRILTEDYGYLISGIASVKERNDINILTLSVPGTSVRSAQYHNNRFALIIPQRDGSIETSLAHVFGSNCYESDIIAMNMSIPVDLSIDDKVLISSCGSYDIMNSSNWIRSKPKLIVISNGEHLHDNYRPA